MSDLKEELGIKPEKIGISTDHINQWEQQLTDNQKTIDNVLLLRSKLYAHTDNPMTDYNYVDISFKEIKQLLDIAGEILLNIYNDVFQTGLRLNSPTFDRQRFTILKLLACTKQVSVGRNAFRCFP